MVLIARWVVEKKEIGLRESEVGIDRICWFGGERERVFYCYRKVMRLGKVMFFYIVYSRMLYIFFLE